MKKAEDLLSEKYNIKKDTRFHDYDYLYRSILDAIKLAQIDAIEETCKVCAEKAKLKIEEIDYRSCTYQDCATDDLIEIDENSILNCAEILKKEIE